VGGDNFKYRSAMYKWQSLAALRLSVNSQIPNQCSLQNPHHVYQHPVYEIKAGIWWVDRYKTIIGPMFSNESSQHGTVWKFGSCTLLQHLINEGNQLCNWRRRIIKHISEFVAAGIIKVGRKNINWSISFQFFMSDIGSFVVEGHSV